MFATSSFLSARQSSRLAGRRFLAVLGGSRFPHLDSSSFAPSHIIKKDVAIIGGGATGTYAAIRLKDKGKSAIVIEQKARIGGHTDTYIDPETKIPIDIGVKLFQNLTLVHNYFSRFGLELIPFDIFDQPLIQNVDFKTGKQITGLPPTNQTAVADAFQRYAEQVFKYPDLNRGFFIPEPVPEDLLLPFGEFVAKYHLEAALYNILSITAALGNILELPTLQVIRTQGISLLTTTLLTTARQNNSELYSKAQDELLASNSLLLSSTVLASSRGRDGESVKLLVKTPSGPKLIIAKKLLITVPPKLDYLAPLDTSTEERKLFRKFTSVGYYIAIVKNAGITPGLQLNSYGQDTPYFLPQFPALYNINPTPNPNLNLLIYGTKFGQTLTDKQVKADIIAGIRRYQRENPSNATLAEPEVVEFRNHSPYNLMVSAEETRSGFYRDLYALQGKRNTWWTGAAWKAQDSSMSWLYTEESVLPGLLAGL
ncbi:putative FAD dependent oxidoreductase [Massariosphaeria phaeospora]|uniref:Putative FAD dependent oxidoreductase n=1 Tax=Massariosphaeria phaeospora TaxID=100035 RepID=A0A7C8HZK3_9PLEO|nr:putative FAD dependent oxidoreductase [Massariosphaeria phaeospora]